MAAKGSQLIREMQRLKDAGGITYVLDLVNLLKSIPIDTQCEHTGVTPLLWSIENDFLFSFCLTQMPDVNARGTGDYDLTPIEFAMQRNEIEKADTLARWGADCPREVQAYRQTQREALQTRMDEIKSIQKRLDDAIEEHRFVTELQQLTELFQVEPRRVRKRHGQLVFKNVKLKQLSKAQDESTEDWFAKVHDQYASRGICLFTRNPLGWKASLEVCAAPTIVHREVIAISSLMSDQGEDVTGERMVTADKLDEVQADSPFRMLSCGWRGILIRFLETPNEPNVTAQRLGEIAPKLHWNYEIRHDAEIGNSDASPVDTLPMIVADLGIDPFVFLPWE